MGLLETLRNAAPDIQAFKKIGQALDEGPPAKAIEDTQQWITSTSNPETTQQDTLPEGVEVTIVNSQQIEE